MLITRYTKQYLYPADTEKGKKPSLGLFMENLIDRPITQFALLGLSYAGRTARLGVKMRVNVRQRKLRSSLKCP